MENYHDYFVTWTPCEPMGATVDKIKVIDAWASTGDMEHARNHMLSETERYLEAHGPGKLEVFRACQANRTYI